MESAEELQKRYPDSSHLLKEMHIHAFILLPLPELVLAVEDPLELFGGVNPLFPEELIPDLEQGEVFDRGDPIDHPIHREGVPDFPQLVPAAGTALLPFLQLQLCPARKRHLDLHLCVHR
jgi:hypothetical protein